MITEGTVCLYGYLCIPPYNHGETQRSPWIPCILNPEKPLYGEFFSSFSEKIMDFRGKPVFLVKNTQRIPNSLALVGVSS
jgi:hypothetical protein